MSGSGEVTELYGMQAASMIDESANTTFFMSVPIDSSLILFSTSLIEMTDAQHSG